VAAAQNVIARGNLIEGIMGDAVRALGDYGLYEDNIIQDFYGVDSHHDDMIQSWSGGTGGVAVGTSVVKGIVIRGNRMIHQTTSNPHFPDTYGVQGMGLFDGYFEDFVIENNLIITDMFHGITLLGAINCKVVNNTVVRGPYQIFGRNPWIQIAPHKNQGASTGNLVRNNLVSTINTSGRDADLDHNIETGVSYASHFVDYEGLDFHLIASSSAINAGSSELAPNEDFDGVVRDSIPDAGAYEFAGNEITMLFPTATSSAAGRYTVSWFGQGDIYGNDYPWLFHERMGWMWVGRASVGSYYFYDLKLGWIYTSPSTSNYYYSFSLGEWLYHWPTSGTNGTGRWFFKMATKEWFMN